MPAESVDLKGKSTELEGKTKGIAVNLTTMPIFKNLFITISTTLMVGIWSYLLYHLWGFFVEKPTKTMLGKPFLVLDWGCPY
jgi:hypothetical protein